MKIMCVIFSMLFLSSYPALCLVLLLAMAVC